MHLHNNELSPNALMCAEQQASNVSIIIQTDPQINPGVFNIWLGSNSDLELLLLEDQLYYNYTESLLFFSGSFMANIML